MKGMDDSIGLNGLIQSDIRRDNETIFLRYITMPPKPGRETGRNVNTKRKAEETELSRSSRTTKKYNKKGKNQLPRSVQRALT